MSTQNPVAQADARTERLYQLLPGIYRKRDEETSRVLRALLAILYNEVQTLEQDIEGLYDDWFIETCAPWLVPYVGDLLGIRGLSEVAPETFSQRAFVANTLRNRRRKGTPPVLEEVARDVTGWPSRAVEFFQVLSTTQHVNHVRLRSPATVSLRSAEALERIGGAFDESPRTVDIRHIASGRGRHNLPNVGLFLWRIESYPIVRATACQVPVQDAAGANVDGCYSFSPLGIDWVPLFNRPVTEREISHVAEEENVPGVLRRRVLYEDLQAFRGSGWSEQATRYFGLDPVFEVSVEGEPSPVLAADLSICDLSVWRRPATGQPLVAIDPALGRLTFRDVPAGEVIVSYSYGFAGDLGGGPYDRQASLSPALAYAGSAPTFWQIGVSREPAPGVGPVVNTLEAAINAWNLGHTERVGIISILDNRTYEESLTEIIVPPGKTLLLAAAQWPETVGTSGVKNRIPGHVVLSNRRPLIRGSISIRGSIGGPQDPGEAILDGLLVDGPVSVSPGDLGRLRVAHSTIVPPLEGVSVGQAANGTNNRLTVELDRAISGPIDLQNTGRLLRISDSIVDAGSGDAIHAPEADVRIDRSTIFGLSRTRALHASDAIFTGKVAARRRQDGCVRFSFVPSRSTTPRRYRCQPDLALDARAAELHVPSARHLTVAQREAVLTRVRPAFTSETYGEPGYAQLSVTGPSEIATGGAEGMEMGAFAFLRQPQRARNLRFRLDEYLPFGLEAGMIFET